MRETDQEKRKRIYSIMKGLVKLNPKNYYVRFKDSNPILVYEIKPYKLSNVTKKVMYDISGKEI